MSPLFDQPFTFGMTDTSSNYRSSNAGTTATLLGGEPLQQRRSGSNNNNYADASTERTPIGSSTTNNNKPFHMRRRRNNSTLSTSDKYVQTAMRAVLLSPIIVLVLWSVCAMAFTSKQQQRNQAATNSRGTTARNKYKNVQEGMLKVVEVAGAALGQEQPKALQAQAATTPIKTTRMAVRTRAKPKSTANNVVVQPLNLQGHTMMMLSENKLVPMAEAEPQPPLQVVAQQQQQDPTVMIARPELLMAQQEQAVQVNMPIPIQAIEEPERMQVQPNEPPLQLQVQSPPQQQVQPNESPPQLRVQPTDSSAQLQTTAYFYYNPKDLVHDEHGQLVLPSLVYDAQGRSVSLASIQQVAKQVYFEPPKARMSAPKAALSSTSTNTATTTTAESLKWSDASPWDQSILICTVGVMALLVGAVSARKLRHSRSILSACIENESLQDEIAYDTAYTVASDSYNTFGWKGDLEKFDV
jgi:hypothetical protein